MIIMKPAALALQLGILVGLILLRGSIGSNYALAQGDNPPNVSFTNISANQTLSGIQTIQVSATDPDPGDDISFVQILYLQGSIPQGEIAFLDRRPFQKDWDTTTVANGTYQLQAKASDFSGNNSTATVIVQVQNGPANAPSTNPGSLAAIAVIVALGLIGAMVLYRARSRKRLNIPGASTSL